MGLKWVSSKHGESRYAHSNSTGFDIVIRCRSMLMMRFDIAFVEKPLISGLRAALLVMMTLVARACNPWRDIVPVACIRFGAAKGVGEETIA
jgi:hypothetical protein